MSARRLAGRSLPTNVDLAELVLLALVDLERDVEAVFVALDLRLVDAHRDEAVLVVPGGEALGVGAAALRVQHAGAGDEREEPLLLLVVMMRFSWLSLKSWLPSKTIVVDADRYCSRR